jgi:hypothetical protein
MMHIPDDKVEMEVDKLIEKYVIIHLFNTIQCMIDCDFFCHVTGAISIPARASTIGSS